MKNTILHGEEGVAGQEEELEAKLARGNESEMMIFDEQI
jgi:hypothetical protein